MVQLLVVSACACGWHGLRGCLLVAVCLVVPYAKQPVRAEGLGSDAGVGAFFRRPSGLRANW